VKLRRVKFVSGSVSVFAETSYTGDSIGVSRNGTTIHKTTS
jgi:hypothetical protein